MQTVVDVAIEFGGKATTYVTPERTTVIYTPDNSIISTELRPLLQEVEADKMRSQEAIKMHDAHVQNVRECDELLEQWNPDLRDKRQTEERFGRMEERFDRMESMMSKLISNLGVKQ